MFYQRQLKYLDLILKNNKVPHAFLFYGRDAVYLKETAKDFLAQLNEAEHAESIKAEIHPDTLFVKRQPDKKDIAIAQIRAVKDFSARTPLTLRKKGIFQLIVKLLTAYRLHLSSLLNLLRHKESWKNFYPKEKEHLQV